MFIKKIISELYKIVMLLLLLLSHSLPSSVFMYAFSLCLLMKAYCRHVLLVIVIMIVLNKAGLVSFSTIEFKIVYTL